MAIESPAKTNDEDARCVCSHSFSAHGLRDPGCGFCSCKRFTRPAVQTDEVQLGKYASTALELLSKDPTLRGMPKDALTAFVKDGHGRMFASGAYLVHRGDRSQDLHVVLEGSVKVESKEGTAGHQVGVGTIAGDIGALTDQARQASVYAIDNVLALEVDTGKLRQMFGEHPDFFMTLVQALGKFGDNPDEVIMATVQAALEQQTVERADQQREGLDPDKAVEIAARWRKLKEEERAASDRAREAAQRAIESQTKRR